MLRMLKPGKSDAEYFSASHFRYGNGSVCVLDFYFIIF